MTRLGNIRVPMLHEDPSPETSAALEKRLLKLSAYRKQQELPWLSLYSPIWITVTSEDGEFVAYLPDSSVRRWDTINEFWREFEDDKITKKVLQQAEAQLDYQERMMRRHIRASRSLSAIEDPSMESGTTANDGLVIVYKSHLALLLSVLDRTASGPHYGRRDYRPVAKLLRELL